MLDSLKNLLSDKSIEEMNSKITEHSELIQKQNELLIELANNLKQATKELNDFKKEHVVLQQVFDNNLDHVKRLKSDFEKEISDFKILKSRIEETMADRVSVNLSGKLEPHISRIKTDAQTYNALKEQLNSVTLNLNQLKEEITRLKDVSSKIKASDFELKVYANELLKQDQYKLELMRKIDTLQNVISHERRRQQR